MKGVTIAELQANIDTLLEEVLETGVPLEVKIGGRKLQIVAVARHDKLANLVRRPEVIRGDPEDLVTVQWEVSACTLVAPRQQPSPP